MDMLEFNLKIRGKELTFDNFVFRDLSLMKQNMQNIDSVRMHLYYSSWKCKATDE